MAFRVGDNLKGDGFVDRREAVDRLVQAVMKMSYGEMLTFNEIGSIID